MKKIFIAALTAIIGLLPASQALAIDVTVTVTTPGTLSEEIAKKAFNPEEVTKLTVNGTLDADMDNIWFNYSSSLEELDLSHCTLERFENCIMMSKLRKVVLPNSTKELALMGVYLCAELQQFVMPEIENLGGYNFMYCPKLTEVHLPGTVTQGSIMGVQHVYHESIAPSRRTVTLQTDEDGNVVSTTHHVPEMALERYKELYDQEGETVVVGDIKISNATITDFVTIENVNQLQGVNLKLFGENKGGSLTVDAGNTPWNLNRLEMVINYDEDTYAQDEEGNSMETYKQMSRLLVKNTPVKANEIILTLEGNTSKVWNYFSLPFDAEMKDVETSPTKWVVRRFDGELRTQQGVSPWVNVGLDEILKAHVPYIITRDEVEIENDYDEEEEKYYESDNNPYIFHAANTLKKQDVFATDDVEIPLEMHKGKNNYSTNWNFVANPYPCNLPLNAIEEHVILHIPDYYGGYYTFNTLDDQVMLAPLMPFFLQSTNYVTSLHISQDARYAGNAKLLEKADEDEEYEVKHMAPDATNRQLINITLSDGKRTDRTRLVINPKATLAYEMNSDAAKLAPTRDVPQIYIMDAGTSLAICERPIGNGYVNLGMQITTEGEQSIHYEGKNVSVPVLLIDREAGKVINLNEGDYTFNAQPGTLNTRFALVVDTEATSVAQITSANEDNAQLFDLMGRHMSTNNNARVYIKGNKKVIK